KLYESYTEYYFKKINLERYFFTFLATLAKEVIFLITERDAWTINGYLGIVIIAVMALVAVLSLIYEEWLMSVIFFISAIIFGCGFSVIQPNVSMIVKFGGDCSGCYRKAGICVFVSVSFIVRMS